MNRMISINTHFKERDFCSIGYALQFVDVLRIGLFHALENLFVVPSNFVRLVLFQKDIVQVLVMRQECLDVALKGPALPQTQPFRQVCSL